MRLIDADEIRWVDHYDSDGNLSKYKVAYSDEMPPTVDAIPIEWIEEYYGDEPAIYADRMIEVWRREHETD